MGIKQKIHQKWHLDCLIKMSDKWPRVCPICGQRLYFDNLIDGQCSSIFKCYSCFDFENECMENIMKWHQKNLRHMRKMRKIWKDERIMILCCYCFNNRYEILRKLTCEGRGGINE